MSEPHRNLIDEFVAHFHRQWPYEVNGHLIDTLRLCGEDLARKIIEAYDGDGLCEGWHGDGCCLMLHQKRVDESLGLDEGKG